jgi:hypothetical protein
MGGALGQGPERTTPPLPHPGALRARQQGPDRAAMGEPGPPRPDSAAPPGQVDAATVSMLTCPARRACTGRPKSGNENRCRRERKGTAMTAEEQTAIPWNGLPPSRQSCQPSTPAGHAPAGHTPETDPQTDAEPAAPGDAQELEQEIERSREQLGATAEELAARTEAKARARDKAAELSGRVKSKTGQARKEAAARAASARSAARR